MPRPQHEWRDRRRAHTMQEDQIRTAKSVRDAGHGGGAYAQAESTRQEVTPDLRGE